MYADECRQVAPHDLRAPALGHAAEVVLARERGQRVAPMLRRRNAHGAATRQADECGGGQNEVSPLEAGARLAVDQGLAIQHGSEARKVRLACDGGACVIRRVAAPAPRTVERRSCGQLPLLLFPAIFIAARALPVDLAHSTSLRETILLAHPVTRSLQGERVAQSGVRS